MHSVFTELTVALICFQGQAILCKAIGYDFNDVLKILLSHGANANSRDPNVSVIKSLVCMPCGKPL